MDDRIPERRDSHASSSHEPSSEPTPTTSVDLDKHSVFLTSLKTKTARSVRVPKLQEPRAEDALAEPYVVQKNFGDLITADHKVLSEGCESRNNHRYAIVVQDLATQWIQSYPCKTKTSQETQRSLQKFLEQDRKPKVIYTDNSLEFGKACEDLSWNHCTSTPQRSETNGIAERCYIYLRNIQDLLSHGKTPYERRFGKPSKGPTIPFGSLVEYHPISAKDQSRIHHFGKKVLLDCSSDTLCTRGEFGRVA